MLGAVQHYDSIIIGAGAAGMLCAALAGQRGRRVLLLDHSQKVAEKIRISGGGRCNFTNLHTRPECYLSENPHFCRSALARYTPQHFLALIDKHRIPYHEKTLGQLFCDDHAQRIIDMLQQECAAGGVHVRRGCSVHTIRKPDHFVLETSEGLFHSHALVIASGGLSIPQTGASPFGYRVAEQFGLRVTPLQPALVPFALPPEDLARFAPLAGLSLPVEARLGDGQFREAMLLTHRGLSGPAILQVSSYWRPGDWLELDLLPDTDLAGLLRSARRDKAGLPHLLSRHWPKRFADAWCALFAPDRALQQFSDADIAQLAGHAHGWRLQPSGTLGYKKAEVTLGGVDTAALSQKTMEARTVPGLFFIGEVVDVTGWLGGYNFQWAWASAAAAAEVL